MPRSHIDRMKEYLEYSHLGEAENPDALKQLFEKNLYLSPGEVKVQVVKHVSKIGCDAQGCPFVKYVSSQSFILYFCKYFIN